MIRIFVVLVTAIDLAVLALAICVFVSARKLYNKVQTQLLIHRVRKG
jgi:hypothetical protein